MKQHREVWIVDSINDIKDLIALSILGHMESSNKEQICTILSAFVEPKLEEICDKLQFKEENDDE